MRTSIAGDIRRIRRNILKPNGNGMVVADYGELHKVLDEIEAKEKHYKSLVRELADIVDCSVKEHAWIVECSDKMKVCDECLSDKCANKKRISLVDKAREATK